MGKKGTISVGLGLVCFVLFILVLAFSSVTQAATAVPVVSVSPATMEVSHGDTFTIEITIDPKGNEIFGAQYTLYFRQDILKALTQTRGTFLSQDGANTHVFLNETNNTAGKIRYSECRIGVENGVANPGTLASISFEVIGTSGTSYLKLSNVKLSDANGERIETTVNHGSCSLRYKDTEHPPTSTTTPSSQVHELTVEEANRMLEEKPAQIILLDVRTEKEYHVEHIPGAVLIPLSELGSRTDELDRSKDIIVYSRSGIRSREGCEMLAQHGFKNIYNMLGGIEAWRLHKDFPISRPTPTPTPTPTPKTELTPAIAPSSSPAATTPPSHRSSPSPSPAPAHSPAPAIRGFEAVFAIAMLAISYLLTKRRRNDRNE